MPLHTITYSSGDRPPPALAEVQLRSINHRYANALASADVQLLDELLANDFQSMNSLGEWVDRAAYLQEIRRQGLDNSVQFDAVSYDDVRVRLFGTVALLHGVLETAAFTVTTSPIKRVRYTDVYQWDGAQWNLINTQHTAIKEGVAKFQHHGTAPAFKLWQGWDPVGDDAAVLRTLNDNYVNAFREANIAWYDAHLSHDFTVVNSDGAFHDRAKALGEFAQPVFATNMRSFPVDKVQVRIYGSIALIHAENAYERKDNKKGVNRYTDIWHKPPDQRWQCIAAHITTHRTAS